MTKTAGLNKKYLGFPLALIIMLIGYFFPPIDGLSHEGAMGLALLLAAVALWMCETLPMGVIGLLALVIAPMLGIAQINTVFSGFASTATIFAIAVFSLTVIVMKSDLATRLTSFFVRFAGTDSKKLLLAFMAAGALMSSVMSDTATLVLFLGLADVVLEKAHHVKGESRLAKCLYLGCAFSIFVGGIATPAGASLNVLALGLIHEITGQTVSFLNWTIIFAPIAVVMVPIIWIVLIKIFKPEPVSQECVDSLIERSKALGAFSSTEKKTLFLLVAIPLCWILGSWIPALDVTTVSVIGLALMCAPKVGLLTWEEFQKQVPWTIVIMIGSVISLGAIISATGGVSFLANLFLNSGVMNLNIYILVWLIVIVVYFVHTLVPVGPAFIAILAPPLTAYFVAVGYSAAIPAMILAAILAGNMLLPINPGLALTYKDNVYTFGESFKAGLTPVFAFSLLLALWVPFMTGVTGVPL